MIAPVQESSNNEYEDDKHRQKNEMEHENGPMKQLLLVSAYQVRQERVAVELQTLESHVASSSRACAIRLHKTVGSWPPGARAWASVPSPASECVAEQQLDLGIALEARLDVLRVFRFSFKKLKVLKINKNKI